jgi:hypothetical protein
MTMTKDGQNIDSCITGNQMPIRTGYIGSFNPEAKQEIVRRISDSENNIIEQIAVGA